MGNNMIEAMTGVAQLKRENAQLNESLEAKDRQIASLNTQNLRYFHVLNQLKKFHKKEFSRKWHTTPWSVSPYALIKTALHGSNKNIRLLKNVPSEYKHRARDLANLCLYVVEQRMSIKEGLKKVLDKRGESYRRFEWNDSSQPYSRKA